MKLKRAYTLVGLLVVILVFSTRSYAQETNYQKNLKLASDIYIAKLELPDSVLIMLVPDNDEEFGLLYGTTHSDRELQNSGFFYNVTQKIFDKVIVEKKEKFYFCFSWSCSLNFGTQFTGAYSNPCHFWLHAFNANKENKDKLTGICSLLGFVRIFLGACSS